MTKIYNEITSSDFYIKALDFCIQKILVFESEQEALKFLSLYCTLLAEKQYSDFNKERLFNTYKKINNLLLQNKKISTKYFLENSQSKTVYVLKGTMCMIFHICWRKPLFNRKSRGLSY